MFLAPVFCFPFIWCRLCSPSVIAAEPRGHFGPLALYFLSPPPVTPLFLISPHSGHFRLGFRVRSLRLLRSTIITLSAGVTVVSRPSPPSGYSLCLRASHFLSPTENPFTCCFSSAHNPNLFLHSICAPTALPLTRTHASTHALPPTCVD